MHKYASSNQPFSSAPVSIGIVGARGYSGLELAKILLRHPQARLSACFASEPTQFSLKDELGAAAASVPTLPMSALENSNLAKEFHTIFLATPAEVSAELAPKIVQSGVNVIDLSGAFRLKAIDYPKWYGFSHAHPEVLEHAEYGLVPFAKPFSKPAKSGRGVLVANPGCYVTSVLLGLIPILKNGLIDSSTIVIDAKSGTTGAGKKPSEGLLFSEVDGECLPYKIGAHQHFPEILRGLQMYAGTEASLSPFFSTSLLPAPRGIISGIYARLLPGKTEADVAQAFEGAYAGQPLIECASMKTVRGTRLLSLKRVVGTNRAQIAYTVDSTSNPAKLYLYSLIDNLLKGAASQAVENWNRLLDQPAWLGLEETAR